MAVSLTPAKKQNILSLCVKLLAVEQTPIRQVAQLLGTFSSSFIELPHSKLYYRPLETCKTKSLVINPRYLKVEIENHWCLYPNFKGKADATSFGWGHH